MPIHVPFDGSVPYTEATIAAADKRGITVDQLMALGVVPVHESEDFDKYLPGWRETDAWWESKGGPGCLFPVAAPGVSEGVSTYQYRPDTPIKKSDGDELKYLYLTGVGSTLNTMRPVSELTNVVMIQEGTFQSLAAYVNTDPDIAVYGIGGCWAWRKGKISLPDLYVVEGKPVVISVDADFRSKGAVFDAVRELTKAVKSEGATAVSYLIAPGGMGENIGLDDVLRTKAPERRKKVLRNLITEADKTLGKRPTNRVEAQAASMAAMDRLQANPERPVVIVNEDRLDVINLLSKTLIHQRSGETLFNFGGNISEFKEYNPITKKDSMSQVSSGRFKDLCVQNTQCVQRNSSKDGVETFVPAWPDSNTLDAAMSRGDDYAPLVRMTHTPFIREDGTACLTPGYDEASQTLLVLDEAMKAPGVLHVGEEPEDLEKAVTFIRHWLSDPFRSMKDEASRTNYVGLLLTPLTRNLYDLAPLAVISGLAPEVGKGLVMDLFFYSALGRHPQPLSLDKSEQEIEKTLFSVFREGTDVVQFDETPELKSRALAKALTAQSIHDRILGGSVTGTYPNRATWLTAGNQVRAGETIERRTYPIFIKPEGEWRNRGQDTFVIPFIEEWTQANRPKIISALLTMIRAWYLKGCPKARSDFSNFHGWMATVGGILEVAGFKDFLANRKQWRIDSSFDETHWTAHLLYGAQIFPNGQTFKVAEMVRQMKLDEVRGECEAPPNLDIGIGESGYSRKLGSAYGFEDGVPHGDLKLVNAGRGHNNTTLWKIVPFGVDNPRAGGTGDGGGMGPGEGSGGPEAPKPTSGDNTGTNRHYKDSPNTADLSVSPSPSTFTLPVLVSTDSEPKSGGTGGSGSTPIPAEKLFFHDQERLNSTSARNGAIGHPPVPPLEPSEALLEANPQVKSEMNPLDQVETPIPPAYEAIDVAAFSMGGSIDLPEGVVVFDIEAADKRIWPLRDDFIKITGYQVGKTIRVAPTVEEALKVLGDAEVVVGQNILGYDLVAFAAHHGLDIQKMADEGRIIDTMLSDVLLSPPEVPGFRDKLSISDVMKIASLNSQAERRLGKGEGKTDHLPRIAKKFGGFDKIPNDDKEYVTYCAGDVDVTARIAATMELTPYIRREHRVGAIAARIRMAGFRVDRDLVIEKSNAARATRKEKIEKLADSIGMPLVRTKNGGPGKRVGDRLDAPQSTTEGKVAIDKAFDDLGIRLERTTKGTGPRIQAEYLLEIQEAHPDNEAVYDLTQTLRELVGVRSVFETVEKNMAIDRDGVCRVHPNITMFQASGRWSFTDPGLTVFGKNGGRHHERKIFLGDNPGHKLVSFDLAQIDARAVAIHSQDENYISNFIGTDPATGKLKDLHNQNAAAVWGPMPLDEHGKHPRRLPAKALGHAWNYNVQLKKLAEMCGDYEVAAQFDSKMRQAYPDLVAWREWVVAMGGMGELLDNGFGRPLRANPRRAFTQAPGLVGQSWSMDILKEAILRMPYEVQGMLRAVVHDEVVFSIPTDRHDEIVAIILEAMNFQWSLPDYWPNNKGLYVPIEAEEAGSGLNWGEVYE